MGRLKYMVIILFLLIYPHIGYGFEIAYGSIRGVKGQDILVQYYGIENKQYFLCRIITTICTPTTKKSLGSLGSTLKPSQKIMNRLKKEKADYIALSPYKNLLAYYLIPRKHDGKRSFVVEDLKTKKKYVFGVSTVPWDLISDERKLFDFLPDKKTVVYLDDRDGTSTLYTMRITSKTKFTDKKIPTDGYVIKNFLVFNSQKLYYVGNTKENPYVWSLYEYNLKTNKDKKIDDFVSYTGPLHKIGNYISYEKLEKLGFGPRLYNPTKNKITTFSFPGISPEKDLSAEEIINENGMYGVLMKPETSNTNEAVPLVIWLHGGSYRQGSYGYHSFHSYGIYDGMLELLRKNGVAVLKLDYSGSAGFGKAYANTLTGAIGKRDVEDVVKSIDIIKSRYNIKDVYLAGNSYGGYLALKTIVEHPSSIKSVMSINGVTDWESLLLKIKTSIFNDQFYGLPNPANQSLYDQASIINKIQNLSNQKIYIVQGQSDKTIAPWQATLLADKLKAQNKNVTLIPYDREDHVLYYKKNIADLCNQMFNLVNIAPDPECIK